MQKWDYAQIQVRLGPTVWWVTPGGPQKLAGAEVLPHLQGAGREGWELVAVTEEHDRGRSTALHTVYTLKRRIEE